MVNSRAVTLPLMRSLQFCAFLQQLLRLLSTNRERLVTPLEAHLDHDRDESWASAPSNLEIQDSEILLPFLRLASPRIGQPIAGDVANVANSTFKSVTLGFEKR